MAIMPKSIPEAIQRFDELYFEAIESATPTLYKATQLLHQQTSKHIRPLLLTLVANCFAPVTDRIIRGSVFIELLHVSTLIHDDVVDESNLRRGVPSMNAIFDNQKAVLIGDYLLSSAMTQAIELDNKTILKYLALLGKNLSEGELLQMDTAELGDFSEERYLDIIDHKTASLIEVSMQVGAVLAGQEDEKMQMAMRKAGNLLGRAFQIKDDIFDYLPSSKLGKPSGQDLREHKVTLPLIYALNCGGKQAEKVLKLLRHEQLTREEVAYIIDFSEKKGGISYAQDQMTQMTEEAKSIFLDSLPDCQSRTALLWVADYIINRDK